MEDPALAVAIGLALLTLFAISVFAARRMLRPQMRLTALEHRIGHVEDQLDLSQVDIAKTKHDVANIRMMMGTLPTAQAVGDVKVQVAQVSGKVEGLATSMSSVHVSVGRIENFLMEASARAIAKGNHKGQEG